MKLLQKEREVNDFKFIRKFKWWILKSLDLNSFLLSFYKVQEMKTYCEKFSKMRFKYFQQKRINKNLSQS